MKHLVFLIFRCFFAVVRFCATETEEAPKIEVQEAPKIETPQRIPEIESKNNLLIKRAHLHSLMDNKTWEDLIKKQGEPNTWTEEQLDRWIKKLEGKNA